MVIGRGAELAGWELDRLLGDTLEAMRAEEQAIEQAVAEAGARTLICDFTHDFSSFLVKMGPYKENIKF